LSSRYLKTIDKDVELGWDALLVSSLVRKGEGVEEEEAEGG
jgi:hypothetical protein